MYTSPKFDIISKPCPIIAIPPTGVWRFLAIYHEGRRPEGYIAKNLSTHSRWYMYITDI